MIDIIKMYFIALFTFLAIDMIWLGVIAKNLYREQLGFLMKVDFNWSAAMAFYMIFIAGLIFFVINPAISKDSFVFALLAGGFFGFVTYATYDLTNLATIRDWPVMITVIDLVWGTALGALTSSISYVIIKKIL